MWYVLNFLFTIARLGWVVYFASKPIPLLSSLTKKLGGIKKKGGWGRRLRERIQRTWTISSTELTWMLIWPYPIAGCSLYGHSIFVQQIVCTFRSIIPRYVICSFTYGWLFFVLYKLLGMKSWGCRWCWFWWSESRLEVKPDIGCMSGSIPV